MKDQVFWAQAHTDVRSWPPLARDLELDVAIVGGGIVGLAAAHLLAGTSLRVALFEGLRIGTQATGRSTAKVTSQHGPIYRRLIADIGEDGARAYASANQDALEWIVDRAGESAERVHAYIYAGSVEEAEELREEAEAARALGLPASFEPDAGIPLPHRGALRFARQAQTNPYSLLLKLSNSLSSNVQIFENTRIIDIEHGTPCRLQTGEGMPSVRARWVIVATQMPVISEGKFFAKAYPHAHAVVAARLAEARRVIPGMYLSAGEPSRSFRHARLDGNDYIVATGDAFQPGERDEQAQEFESLERFLREHFGIGALDYRWTNEDFSPMDGLPFVGAASAATPELLVATGFNAWGISSGVVAANILVDTLQGREHPLAACLEATRLRPLKGGAEFVAENMQAGAHLARDRVLRAKVEALEEIAPGEGGIISHHGRQVAVSRDAAGRITAVSAICTHLGCVVGWNPVDRSWDCPCHGSRFEAAGRVLAGPAVAPLEPIPLDPGADDQQDDMALDEALKGTFPASDPIALSPRQT
jgi:glycine/D-amino acid oxidase-like deaminating enzyme/nitrite reductase/ring-hydroxylating ferredoxin subunit